MPIIAFTKRPEVKAVLEYEIVSLTGNTPVIYENIKDFQAVLELFPKLNCLLIDATNGSEELEKYIQSLIQNPDRFEFLVLLDSENHQSLKVRGFQKNDFLGMFTYLKEVIECTDFNYADWIGIPIGALVHFKQLPFDLYIKLTPKKFLKRIRALEEIDEASIQNFKTRGIAEIYFNRAHNKEFSKLLIYKLINRIEIDYENEIDKLKSKSEIFITLKELVRIHGLIPNVLRVCESFIGDTIRNITDHEDKLSEHIKCLQKKSEFSFHFRLVELTSYLCAYLYSAIDPVNYLDKIKSIVYASFFCDIGLADEEDIHHLDDTIQNSMMDDLRNDILTHAWRASKLVFERSSIPREAALVIRQHHGSVEGVGFPEVINSKKLTLLSKCFILSQEFAYQILVNPHLRWTEVLNMTFKNKHELASKSLLKVFEKLLKNSTL